MRQITFPNWLIWVDKKFRNLAIPKLPLVLIIIQILGFLLSMVRGQTQLTFIDNLVLYPSNVYAGQIWRVFTFIAIPLVSGNVVVFIVFCIVLWFFYDVMVWLEETWGSMFLTIYFLIAWLSTVFAAFCTDTSVSTGSQMSFFFYAGCSFIFALATLNPNKELHLFFILPIAFKWIALFAAGILFVSPFFLDFKNQLLFVILVFANYLIFFGKDYWLRFNAWRKGKKV